MKKNLKSMLTIEKVLNLQRLLKELTFRKKAILDIKTKMYSEIDKNLVKFFEGKIYCKKIFDNILNDNTKVNNDKYVLIPGDKNSLKNLYEPLYNFFFLLQNDNSLMLKIINLCEDHKRYFKPLSEFLVHFFYVDIINCSFNENRLLLMVYLLLEKLILSDNAEENNNLSLLFSKDTFLFHIFQSLTRKIDVRNFLGNILNKHILKLENLRMTLSLDFNEVNKNSRLTGKYLYNKFYSIDNNIIENDIHSKKKLFIRSVDKSKDINIKNNNNDNSFIKRARKITIEMVKNFEINNKNILRKANTDIEDYEFIDENGQIVELNKHNVKLKKRQKDENSMKKKENRKKVENKININFEEIKIQEKEKNIYDDDIDNIKADQNTIFFPLELLKGQTTSLTSEQNNINQNIKKTKKIDIFFQENDITKEQIIKLLNEYKNKNDTNNNINLAMKEYLNNLLQQTDNNKQHQKQNNIGNNNEKLEKKKDEEIFSSSIITEELINSSTKQSEEDFLKLMKQIKINHHIITKIIIKIINDISKNLSNFPYCIKCIFKMIDALLNKRYHTKNLSYFKNYIFKANFLIGNIILPILKNPNYNGIISNIITDTTKNNLKIIYNIFDKMLTGNLFNWNNKEEISMLLYNKFIIETLPKIFEFIDNFEKNFELPDFIKRLVISIDNEEIHKKNINFYYFKENPNENIQSQAICFSLENLYIFSDIINANKKILIDENENIDQKNILKEIAIIFEQTNGKKKNNKTDLMDEFIEGKVNGIIKFFYFNKIIYKNEIEKLLKPNSVPELNKNKDALIKTFKNCLIEILSYESFDYLTEFNNLKSSNLDENNNLKLNIKNEFRSSLTNTLESINEDDADFKKIIFPKIENNLIFEMDSNLDNKLIIFCTNYIKLNIENLPDKYIKENYCLLFDELILETKNNIHILHSDILFEHYKKVNEAEKINILELKYKSQIKKLEKLEYIEYLSNKIILPCDFIVEKDENNLLITNIKYSSGNKKGKIEDMIKKFPDFRVYEQEYDNILDIEESAKVPEAIKEYFKIMEKEIDNEELFRKFDKKEKKSISYDLENYILNKLYDKLFPSKRSEKDLYIYEKFKKLSNLEPENIIKKKQIINETLLKEASKYIEQLDKGITPEDKIKFMSKGLKIIDNLITFGTGKVISGSDDIYPPLIYSIIIAKLKNYPTNVQYIDMFFNKNISEGIYSRIPDDLKAVLIYFEEILENEELND